MGRRERSLGDPAASGGAHSVGGVGIFFLQVSPVPGAGTKVCRRRINPLPVKR